MLYVDTMCCAGTTHEVENESRRLNDADIDLYVWITSTTSPRGLASGFGFLCDNKNFKHVCWNSFDSVEEVIETAMVSYI